MNLSIKNNSTKSTAAKIFTDFSIESIIGSSGSKSGKYHHDNNRSGGKFSSIFNYVDDEYSNDYSNDEHNFNYNNHFGSISYTNNFTSATTTRYHQPFEKMHHLSLNDNGITFDNNFSSYSIGHNSISNNNNDTSSLNGCNNKRYRPKNFQCPDCKMAFSNNGQLKTHVRIHTGERPFRCNHSDCNKTFTRNEELTRHKLIHTGVRPHACSSCGKRFGRKDHLKKHTRTHERNQFCL